MFSDNHFPYTYLENNSNALALYIKKELQKEVLKTKKIPWRRPIFAYTIVGAEELNFCVRDGNRCTLFAIVTKENILRK